MPKKGRYFKEPENKYAVEWTGSIRDMVARVASSDARYAAYDAETGAVLTINISDVPEEGGPSTFEPFYIAHGDDLYDAYNRKEAVQILLNIRAGMKNPDDLSQKRPKSVKKPRKQKAGKGSPSGFGGMR